MSDADVDPTCSALSQLIDPMSRARSIPRVSQLLLSGWQQLDTCCAPVAATLQLLHVRGLKKQANEVWHSDVRRRRVLSWLGSHHQT